MFSAGAIGLNSTCEERELYVANHIYWQVAETLTNKSIDDARVFADDNMGLGRYLMWGSVMAAGAVGIFVREEEEKKKNPVELPEPKS